MVEWQKTVDLVSEDLDLQTASDLDVALQKAGNLSVPQSPG